MSVNLDARWIAKKSTPGCNICNKPFVVGRDQVQFDPKKPTWFNKHSNAEAYNYAHVSCVGSNDAQMGRTTQQAPAQSVKPFSFAPNGAQGDLRKLLVSVRDAINDYLGELDPDAAFAQLDGEIPF